MDIGEWAWKSPVGVGIGAGALAVGLGSGAGLRDAVRQQMLTALQEERVRLETVLRDAHTLLAGGLFAEIEAWQGERFNIYRDGGRPP